MPKGKKGHKMPIWRRAARAAVGGLGAVLGTLVATRPFHRGIAELVKGNFAGGTEAIVYDVGAPGPGGQSVDVLKVIGVGATAAIGIGIFSLFRYVARRI